MQRTYNKDISTKLDGKKVLVKGWVQELRDLNKIKFILLRDYTGINQFVAVKGKTKDDVFNAIPKLTIETVISVEGIVKANKTAKKGFEILIEKLDVINEAETLPITVTEKGITTGLAKRLDYRFIDLRKEKVAAIFKIQSEISTAFRKFFKDRNFIEIQPPNIIATATEGGTELYPVKYFEKDAYLAQSPQLYKQMCAVSIENVFMVVPVWRAEKHNTIRHLNESRQMDIEVAFADEFVVMKYLEDAVAFIVKEVKEKCRDELKILGAAPKVPKGAYITYDEAIKILKKNDVKIERGEDLTPEAEIKLCELNKGDIVFVHDWPMSLKPFYIWPKDNGNSGGFDALYLGMEISSGGQRVHIPKIIEKQLKERNLNPDDFRYYIDAFRYGAPEHAGWSIGLERLTMVLCGLDNIREACLFPRDRDRIVP